MKAYETEMPMGSIELLRDLHPIPDWDIVWHGATWRTFPPPPIGCEPEPRDLTADLRAHFKAHPTSAYMGKNIAHAIQADTCDVQKRLFMLWTRGEVTRERSTVIYKNGRQERRWLYQWAASAPRRQTPRSTSGRWIRAPKMSARYQEAKRAGLV